jgi:hypothetical protein
MNPTDPTRQSRTAELRRRWLSHAAAAFDLVFHPEHQADLTTFDQRERRVDETVEDLKTWLLQQHLDADELAQPEPSQAAACPHCGQPAQRVLRPDKPLFERPLTTLCGEVTLHRPQWRCTTCRVAFFPSGPQTRPEH